MITCVRRPVLMLIELKKTLMKLTAEYQLVSCPRHILSWQLFQPLILFTTNGKESSNQARILKTMTSTSLTRTPGSSFKKTMKTSKWSRNYSKNWMIWDWTLVQRYKSRQADQTSQTSDRKTTMLSSPDNTNPIETQTFTRPSLKRRKQWMLWRI